MPNYGDPAYWDQRYKETEGATFDWLENYSTLKPILAQLLPNSDARVLVLGCGNATFSEELYDDGFRSVVNVDVSQVVVDQMRRRSEGRPQMSFSVMDVRKLDFEANSFDLAFDKSTMDALLCGEDSFLNVARMTREVQRVLKPGGHYVVVSYGNPENRIQHFTLEHLAFTMRSQPIGEGSDLRTAHYCYICEKTDSWEVADRNWAKVEEELAEMPE